MRQQTIARVYEAWLRAGHDPVSLRRERARESKATRLGQPYVASKNPPYELAFKKLARGDTTLIVNMLRARIPLQDHDYALFETHFGRAFPMRGTKVNQKVIEAEIDIAAKLRQFPAKPRSEIVATVSEQRGLAGNYMIDRDRRAKRPVTTYVAAMGRPHHLSELFSQRLPLRGSAFEALAKLTLRKHKQFRTIKGSVDAGGRRWKYWQNLVATVRAYRYLKSYMAEFQVEEISDSMRRALVASVCRDVRKQYACGPIDVDAVAKNIARDGKRIQAILDNPSLLDFPKTP